MARSGNYLAIVVQLNGGQVQAALAGADVALVELFDRAHGDVRQQPDGRGDDEPAIQTRGQVGRAGRSPPGTAGSQDARRDQRGHPVGHRHHSTRSGRGWPLVGPGAPIAPPGTATCGAVSASPRRMIGSTRSLLAHVSDTRSLISGSRSCSAVSASAPVGVDVDVDVERINYTSRTGFAASTLFSTASCSARRSRYSRTTLPWCALRSGGRPANSQRQLPRARRTCVSQLRIAALPNRLRHSSGIGRVDRTSHSEGPSPWMPTEQASSQVTRISQRAPGE